MSTKRSSTGHAMRGSPTDRGQISKAAGEAAGGPTIAAGLLLQALREIAERMQDDEARKRALRMRICPETVTQWGRRGSIPSEWVIPLEMAQRKHSGQIVRDRHQLRPDIYPIEEDPHGGKPSKRARTAVAAATNPPDKGQLDNSTAI